MDTLTASYFEKPRYTFNDEIKAWLRLPKFDNWLWDENELIGLFEVIFVDLGLVKDFDIPLPTLRKFLNTIRENYNNNPFHNFKHSFCVTQMMYAIINVSDLVSKLKPVEKLILTVACIGHDLDHPGYNNAYQVNAKTQLALIYNDSAPLEMHHAACLFRILQNKETDILKNVSESLYRDVRKGIIRCILATDMAKHGDILGQFKKITETFNHDDLEHRALVTPFFFVRLVNR